MTPSGFMLMLMLMGGRGFEVFEAVGESDGLVDIEVEVEVDVDVDGEEVEVEADVDKDVMIGAGAAAWAVGVVSCESCIVLLPLTDGGKGSEEDGIAGAAT